MVTRIARLWRRFKSHIPLGLREWLAGLIRRRRVVVAAGVFLVAVPTLFQIFPGWSSWALWIRVLIAVICAFVAVFVIHGSVRQGEQVEQLFGQERDRRDEQRMLARNRILPLLLMHGTGLPDHYQWRIFMYDAERRRLVASYAPEGVATATEWGVGKGAVGAAYDTGEYVLVRGEAVSDGTYGLTEEQQERFKPLQVVGAAPIRNVRGEILGVLAASSTHDDGQLATPDGQRHHVELATIAGRLIVDLFSDAG